MTNKQIASTFRLLGNIMDLHDESPFKTRAYANAYVTLRKVEKPFAEMSREEIEAIPQVGKNIADKIEELLQTGTLSTLQNYLDITPEGVVEMLGIRGLGPKKIKTIWYDLEIDNVGDLLYACNENRLIAAKGFGAKTQADIKQKLEYFQNSKGKYHYANVVTEANKLVEELRERFPDDRVSLTGEVRRKMPELSRIEILSTIPYEDIAEEIELVTDEETYEETYLGYPVTFEETTESRFGTDLFLGSASDGFLERAELSPMDEYEREEEIFEDLQMSYVEPEYREDPHTVDKAMAGPLPELIQLSDIKGVVHNHSTYSDGLHSVKQMADACIAAGYEYFVISDHSQSAFYAQGLKPAEVKKQWKEIDELNKTYKDFKVFKSIESDILNDGSLDYSDDILRQFDLVIASIHSNLRMDEAKATQRLITAIENKYTTILGHPTGRLLLGRVGYPIDHHKIIDACAENGVAIELNANPLRLDLDWEYIDYAMSKDVMISINPDAHSMDQIHYIKYGVEAARKGGLTTDYCLNALSLEDFEQYLQSK